ncbi:hypothetical protein CPB85DRAFT_932897 [Mucidula mucida]|nr:hypothetical protein CPB85DRAFT_932897 [Mucidula mucida]
MMARVDALIKPDPSTPLDSDLRFYLTAPHSAGVHVHIGNGESGAATLAEDTVKNIAFLFWAYEGTKCHAMHVDHGRLMTCLTAAIDTFHMTHRGVLEFHPAIRSFVDTKVFPSRKDVDFVTKLQIVYDSDVKGLGERLTRGSEMWKVNLNTNHHTIEFRQLASTFTASYVEDWAQFVLLWSAKHLA